jgi:hypothetical protein
MRTSVAAQLGQTVKRYWVRSPATPFGIPLVGCLKYDTLYVSAGRGTFDWTMARGSEKQLANLVTSSRASAAPFSKPHPVRPFSCD